MFMWVSARGWLTALTLESIAPTASACRQGDTQATNDIDPMQGFGELNREAPVLMTANGWR